MAKKKERKFKFTKEYQKGKILIYNRTLGRHLKLSQDQVLNMAEGGRLTENQMQRIFEKEAPAKKEKEA